MSYQQYFSAATWKSLPIEMRQAWWRDTDYGRRLPSREICDKLANDFKIILRGEFREPTPEPDQYS